MNGLLSDRSIRVMQWITCACCALVFVYCIARTLHWQIMWDQSVIRYVHFLLGKGMRPYSEITDMNMPGCYLMEAWGIAIFGSSDLSWRVYEYCLITGIALSGVAIGGRRYWMTGVYGATLFLMIRIADGEQFSMERNEIMAFLSILSMAFFFLAVRGRRPVLIGIGSTLACLAASMKPGGILLEICLLGVLVVALRHEGFALRPYLLWALAGAVLILVIVLAFLLHEHALGNLFFIVFKVWPLFATMTSHDPPMTWLIPWGILVLLPLAVCAAYRNRTNLTRERWAFVLAMGYGALSYKLEGAIASYHRYVFVVFLTTWIGWELTQSLRDGRKGSRLLGCSQVAVLLGLVVPHYVHLIGQANQGVPMEQYSASLQTDLTKLGGSKLQGQVECLEMVDGCLRTLYEMRLVQNTGTTGDLLLFKEHADPAVIYYRDWYSRTQQGNPAKVVVLGNFFFYHDRSFDRIKTWPAYAAVLRDDYDMLEERHFGSSKNPAYRIYVRKGSGLIEAH